MLPPEEGHYDSVTMHCNVKALLKKILTELPTKVTTTTSRLVGCRSRHLCLLEGSLSCCARSTAMGCGSRLQEIISYHVLHLMFSLPEDGLDPSQQVQGVRTCMTLQGCSFPGWNLTLGREHNQRGVRDMGRAPCSNACMESSWPLPPHPLRRILPFSF